MPVQVYQFFDEPILVAHYSGHVDLETARETFRQTNAHLEHMTGTVCRISNFTEATSSFTEILRIVADSQGTPGSTLDPRIHPLFVATDTMIKLAVEFFKQEKYGSVRVPTFRTMDDAIVAARTYLASVKAEQR